MFLNRFRGLFAEVLPMAVWWPSSPEPNALGWRTMFTALQCHTKMLYLIPEIAR